VQQHPLRVLRLLGNNIGVAGLCALSHLHENDRYLVAVEVNTTNTVDEPGYEQVHQSLRRSFCIGHVPLLMKSKLALVASLRPYCRHLAHQRESAPPVSAQLPNELLSAIFAFLCSPVFRVLSLK
jgi:hypothetical protein